MRNRGLSGHFPGEPDLAHVFIACTVPMALGLARGTAGVDEGDDVVGRQRPRVECLRLEHRGHRGSWTPPRPATRPRPDRQHLLEAGALVEQLEGPRLEVGSMISVVIPASLIT